MRRTPWSIWVLTVMGLIWSAGGLFACNGQVQGVVDSHGTPARPGADPSDSIAPVQAAPAVRFARLTHEQWRRSLRDLLSLSSEAPDFAAGLRADPAQNGFIFDNNSLALEVDQALWAAYGRAASDAAQYVVSNPQRFAQLVTETGSEDDRAMAFIRRVGAQAHRRPLTDAQVDAYVAVFNIGRQNPLGTDPSPFAAGIGLVVETMLQSPYFLYRVELSDTVQDGRVALDNYEIASRLSYFLWGTMPDAALFAAAAAGELTRPETLRPHVERMLQSPRATDVVLRYHDFLFDTDKLAGIQPSSDWFPDAPRHLADLVRTERTLFIQNTFEAEGSYKQMLTDTETFADPVLANLYGVQTAGEAGFQRISLDPRQRRGIFTQIGFLAANATSRDPDPIHRGVFLTERIACNPLGAPPENIPPLPAPEGRTNRETIREHTEQPGTACAGCHSTLINPFGFPFEMFDAIGQHRTEDNLHPVDTTASPYVDNEPVMVDDALELVDALASSRSVHRCYASHWIEYAFGRVTARADEGLLTRLTNRSLEEASIRDLLTELVMSSAFIERSAEELP